MQSYPLHTHNVVSFLVGSKRSVYVESYQWQIGLERILILPLDPCGFDTPYLSLSPLGIAMMIPCTWGLSISFLAPLPGSNSVGLIFSCVHVCFLYLVDFGFPFFFCLVVGETYKKNSKEWKYQKKYLPLMPRNFFKKEKWLEGYALEKWGSTLNTSVHAHIKNVKNFMEPSLKIIIPLYISIVL